MNEILSSLIMFAEEVAEETAKNTIKDFFKSKEFIAGSSILISTLISSEIDNKINKKMDECEMPERMDEKERKGFTLKKKLINATVDGTTKALTKAGITSIIKAIA